MYNNDTEIFVLEYDIRIDGEDVDKYFKRVGILGVNYEFTNDLL